MGYDDRRVALRDLRTPNRRPSQKYISEADREYIAKVRENKANKAKQERLERAKQHRQAMKERNAPIIARNERRHRAWQEKIWAEQAIEREKTRLAELRRRLRSALTRRFLMQRMATPKWANKGAMLAFYRKAKRMQETTGVKHHVDHIVPIQNKLVCGLHCEANLQVLTKRENLSKLNRWWPDMPDIA